MAQAKPCGRCGHSKTRHTSTVGRCKYRYFAREGRNLHVGWDTDERGFWKMDGEGRYPSQYQCLCPEWILDLDQ